MWRRRVERVIGIAPHLHLLVGDRGERLRSRWLAVVVREARSHTTDTDVLGACDAVLALLDKHGAGGRVTRKQWVDAAEAAVAVSRRVSNTVAEWVAWAAAWAAPRRMAKAAACGRVIDALLTMIEQEVAP